MEIGVPFVAYNVDIRDPYNNNYHPDYVRMRLLGRPDGTPFVGETKGNDETWTGSSSVASTGFDPCVVPTLVDFGKGTGRHGEGNSSDNGNRHPDGGGIQVLADSVRICKYLVEQHPDSRIAWTNRMELQPNCDDDLTNHKLMEKHLRLIDDTPHMGMFYHGNPERDLRPQYLKNWISADGVRHKQQLKVLRQRLAEEGTVWNGIELKRSYEAKLMKTEHGMKKTKEVLSSGGNHSPYLWGSIARTKEILAELEKDLSNNCHKQWLCGDNICVADLLWGALFHFLLLLGNQYQWEDLPKTTAYVEKLFALESVQNAILFWDGVAPSHHTATELFAKYRGPWAAFVEHRKTDALDLISFCTRHKIGMVTVIVATMSAGYSLWHVKAA